MRWLLKIPVALVGIMMLSMGLRWLLAPAGIAAELGMPLLDGPALSTQIGDLSAFFLTIGLCVLLGLSSGRVYWFYPAIMLLGLTAFGRILAWLFYDAAFVGPAIAVELLFSGILLLGVRFLDGDKRQDSVQ